jgi:hypothetical protein
MTALQKIVLGTPPAAVDGDPVRTASTKVNANVDVLNTQATLTSFATTLTAAQALTAANHLGKRVNINLAAAGTINLPAASTCVADGVILLRNLGATLVTLAITTGSGDTIALTALAAGESALMDTDGAHAWNCLTRGRGNSANEVVQGSLTVGGGILQGPGLTYVPSTANAPGYLSAQPSGTGNGGGYYGYSAAGANAAIVSMTATTAATIINSSHSGTGTANPIDIYVNDVMSTRFASAGWVGINTTSAIWTSRGTLNISAVDYQIALRNTSAAAGQAWLIGPNSNNNIVVFNAGLTGCYIANGATAWSGQSDERLKNIRGDISNAVDAIKDIRTVRYSWKSEDDHAEALGAANDSRVYVGVIAQDVQRHVPEAVSVSHNDYLGVSYTDLVPLCMAAIKELSEKLDKANSAIAALRARPA